MLNPEDRRAIEGLFHRLAEVEVRTPDRDAEAQELIDREVARQPGASYYMAQTVLVQEHALGVAEGRIQELEQQLAKRGGGGLFAGLFDDGRNRQNSTEQQMQPARGPWDRQEDPRRAQGGGFLAGAVQTAVGVAGGVLLGSAIGSMLGTSSAQAAEQPADQPAEPADAGGGEDSGGDWGGDGGGFDMGGDF